MKRDLFNLYMTIAAGMLFVGPLMVRPVLAGQRPQSPARANEEFFIVSSVDRKKGQIVLKHPTEVTELILVTEKTVYLDEEGKKIGFKDIRAGDTVWVTAGRNSEGARVATRIRRGPMTVEELHRRYPRLT